MMTYLTLFTAISLYQWPCPMTGFCGGIGKSRRRHAQAKEVNGLGRWY
jgi:hypothetical protein